MKPIPSVTPPYLMPNLAVEPTPIQYVTPEMPEIPEGVEEELEAFYRAYGPTSMTDEECREYEAEFAGIEEHLIIFFCFSHILECVLYT